MARGSHSPSPPRFASRASRSRRGCGQARSTARSSPASSVRYRASRPTGRGSPSPPTSDTRGACRSGSTTASSVRSRARSRTSTGRRTELGCWCSRPISGPIEPARTRRPRSRRPARRHRIRRSSGPRSSGGGSGSSTPRPAKRGTSRRRASTSSSSAGPAGRWRRSAATSPRKAPGTTPGSD